MPVENEIVERGLTPLILNMAAKYASAIVGKRTYLSAIIAIVAGILAFMTGMVDHDTAGGLISHGLEEFLGILFVAGIGGAHVFQRAATARTDAKIDEHQQTVEELLAEIKRLTPKEA